MIVMRTAQIQGNVLETMVKLSRRGGVVYQDVHVSAEGIGGGSNDPRAIEAGIGQVGLDRDGLSSQGLDGLYAFLQRAG